ncbi:MAG: TRAP transporter TatT component family protein [Thermodesulfobacteriota bacterium]|nr:TRAP transporter TatT component family protein [Thermodesulfobacteriota bacterium]
MKLRRLRAIVGICLVLTFFLGVSGCAYIGERVAKKSIRTFFKMTHDDLIKHILLIDSDMLAREGIGGAGLITMLINGFVYDHREVNSLNALIYAAYGILVEYEDPKYAMYLYQRAREYGMLSLQNNKKFREGLERGEKIHKLVHHMGKEYTGPLLFTSLAWGLQVMLDPDDMFELVNMPDIIAMVDRSIELDEGYLYGLGLTFKGAYYAFVPEFMGLGGGPESSKATFDKAMEKSNGMLVLADTFRARYWATLMKDEEMFDTLLKKTIELPRNYFPEGTLLNELARWKARDYLKSKDEWF